MTENASERMAAAAPELLDAAEKARLVLEAWLSSSNEPAAINELIKVTTGALVVVNAAIAKAQGEHDE